MSASIPPNDAIDPLDPDLREGLRALRDRTAAQPADVARLAERIAVGPRPSAPRWPLAVAPALLFVAGLGLWMAGAPLGPDDVVLADGTLSLAGEPLARTMGQGSSTLDGERVHVDWVVGTIEANAEEKGGALIRRIVFGGLAHGSGARKEHRISEFITFGPRAVHRGRFFAHRAMGLCVPTVRRAGSLQTPERLS